MINMVSDGSSIGVHVESLAASLKTKIEVNLLPLGNCIFKTPSILARHNPKAYIPNYFSIGPLHYDPKKFEVTEKIKLKYLRDLLSRSNNPGVKLKECVNCIREVEGEARDCYAANFVHLAQDKFIEMLVVDGCFIIEMLYKVACVVDIEDDDPVVSVSSMSELLAHDLILLENQLPWLVLERLFEKTKAPSQETKSLLELALKFLTALFPNDDSPDPSLFVNKKIKHILDLQRLLLVLPSEEVQNYLSFSRKLKEQNDFEWEPIPSATRLQEAGVKFVKVKGKSILDIKFRNGVLEIPCFFIQETTETLFLNLISYEQCLPNCKTIFTSYAKVLDSLIDTSNDMELLSKKGILRSWMVPEDATEFFNKLYNDTSVKEFVYSKLCIDLNAYCQRRWPRWRAAYVHNYFTKPWAIAAQIYAVFIFVLTFLQVWLAFKEKKD